MDDLISRQDAIKAVTYGALSSATLFGRSDAGMTALRETVRAIEQLRPAQPEPAIPLSWIEGQIEWLKSLDNAFSTLTAVQITTMVKKWKDEQAEHGVLWEVDRDEQTD